MHPLSPEGSNRLKMSGKWRCGAPKLWLICNIRGIGFGVDGVPLAEDAALIDAGLDFAIGANGSAGVSYTGQFGDGVTDNAVTGRVSWLF